MCGERVSPAASASPRPGSSPHVRGTPARKLGSEQPVRFIPACAGNASGLAAHRCSGTVHPRMCGERIVEAIASAILNGSSPHVRGTPGAARHGHGRDRFIPACAGNAWLARSSAPVATVHPRMCGERVVLIHKQHLLAGSSPHVRGTHRAMLCRGVWSRFIPACAGNADRSPCAVRAVPVHPRMCRERHLRRWLRISRDGSSPHVRGTREQSMVRGHIERFIPACAGNASS